MKVESLIICNTFKKTRFSPIKNCFMRKIFTIFFLLSVFITAKGQTIRLKMPPATPAAGEEILAFEVSDTIPPTSFGGVTSIPRFEFVKIKKLKGSSTNDLFRRSVSGMRAAEAIFEFYDSGGVLYYKIAIKDVSVNHFSYLSPECSGCNQLIHQVWFDFESIEVTDMATGNIVRYNRTTRSTQ